MFVIGNHRMNLLSTPIVFVKDCFDSPQPFRANLITEETVNRLRLKQNKTHVDISGVSGLRTHYTVTATIKSRDSVFKGTCFQ